MDYPADGKRNQLKIITDILDFTRKPRLLTHIMRQMNLNHAQLKGYISLLIHRGLLEEMTEPCRAFRATKKGLDFIDISHIESSRSNSFASEDISSEGGA